MIDGTYLHILVFKSFYPLTYTNTLQICHFDDNPLNANLLNLYLGSKSDNGIDAYNNGKYDNTKSARIPCIGVNKKTDERFEFKSLAEAESWLRDNDELKASFTHISMCINGTQKSAYGFTWHSIS